MMQSRAKIQSANVCPACKNMASYDAGIACLKATNMVPSNTRLYVSWQSGMLRCDAWVLSPVLLLCRSGWWLMRESW